MFRKATAKNALIATVAVGVLGRASGSPTAAAVPVVAPPLVLASIGSRPIRDKYSNRTDRFITAPDQTTWFEDAKTQSKHLVRFRCDLCGEPPPCENAEPVTVAFIDTLKTGVDFACDMFTAPTHTRMEVHERRAPTPAPALRSPVAVTTSEPYSRVTPQPGAGGSSSAAWVFFLLLLCCCCAGIALAAYHFLLKKKKTGKKKKPGQKGFRGNEDQAPLVEDDAPHFGSGNSQQMTAAAPTYTAISPQMGQSAMAAQQASMQTQVLEQPPAAQACAMQQAQMPTYTQLPQGAQQQSYGQGGYANMGQGAMPTQSWSAGQESYSDTQAGMQTMVLEQPPQQGQGGYGASMGTQAMQQASMQTMVLEQPPQQCQGGYGASMGTQAMQQASMQTMVLEQPPQQGQGGYAPSMGTQAAFPSMYQQPAGVPAYNQYS